MKTSRILILTAAALVLTIAPATASQKPEPGVAVPKYDRAAEATFQGTVEEVKDRQCPVSGGIGLRPDLEVVAEQDDRGPPGNYQVREHLA